MGALARLAGHLQLLLKAHTEADLQAKLLQLPSLALSGYVQGTGWLSRATRAVTEVRHLLRSCHTV